MTNACMTGEARFAAVIKALNKEPGVTQAKPGSQTFGHETLTVHDTIFAMVSSAGDLVVKLPKARVDALESGRASIRFQLTAACR